MHRTDCLTTAVQKTSHPDEFTLRYEVLRLRDKHGNPEWIGWKKSESAKTVMHLFSNQGRIVA